MLLPFETGLVRTTQFDSEMASLADRHYSRRTIGGRQFCYAGRKLILRDSLGLVIFVWMFPDPTMREDGQRGYNCAIFRNESSRRSSEIILEAESFAVAQWGPNRAYTFVDSAKILSSNPGCCFKKAGWAHIGFSKGGKHIFEKYLEQQKSGAENPAPELH
jgi:hypothetical protein